MGFDNTNDEEAYNKENAIDTYIDYSIRSPKKSKAFISFQYFFNRYIYIYYVRVKFKQFICVQ